MRKVKPLAVFLIIIVLACGLCACGETETNGAATGDKVKNELIDISAMSGSMAYSQVCNLVQNPQDYLGIKIKVCGDFDVEYSSATDKYYFYVTISDATNCCQKGVEFILSGDKVYPDDYPRRGDKIEIVGTYDSYTELETIYYFVSADTLILK